MQKLLLMSILFATVIIPIILSRDKNPRRGMRRTVIFAFAFVVLWAWCIRRFFWRLTPPRPPDDGQAAEGAPPT